MKFQAGDWIVVSVLSIACLGLLVFLLFHTEPEVSLFGTIGLTEKQRHLAAALEPVYRGFIFPAALISVPLEFLGLRFYGPGMFALILFASVFCGFGPYFLGRYLLHRWFRKSSRLPA